MLLASFAVSNGYSRSSTVTFDRSTRWVTEPYTTKKVKSGPIALACTRIAGSMPILAASCRAAPSARLSCGTGRVNDTWTMPSPVVSPYGRTISLSASTSCPPSRISVAGFQ